MDWIGYLRVVVGIEHLTVLITTEMLNYSLKATKTEQIQGFCCKKDPKEMNKLFENLNMF